jgi:hypothetical protein
MVHDREEPTEDMKVTFYKLEAYLKAVGRLSPGWR